MGEFFFINIPKRCSCIIYKIFTTYMYNVFAKWIFVLGRCKRNSKPMMNFYIESFNWLLCKINGGRFSYYETITFLKKKSYIPVSEKEKYTFTFSGAVEQNNKISLPHCIGAQFELFFSIFKFLYCLSWLL